jgi:ADP-ribose pyrophosphatase YjhB (NUDIX family)
MTTDIHFCARCGQAVEYKHLYGRERPVCPQCGRIHFVDPKVAVAVVIENDHRLLLIQRGVNPELGKWAFPAGFVDGGEDPARAAEREGLEETGLTVRAADVIDVFFRATPTEGADILIAYRADVLSGEMRHDDDAADARYFGADDLPELELAFPSTRAIVERWKSGKWKMAGEA